MFIAKRVRPHLKRRIPSDFPSRIRKLRGALGLTQMRLAELMGVSFASVNRWENGQSRPSALAWQQLVRAEKLGIEALSKDYLEQPLARPPAPVSDDNPTLPPKIYFSTDPEAVRAVAAGERLAYGHLF